jgi:hypothetical protein
LKINEKLKISSRVIFVIIERSIERYTTLQPICFFLLSWFFQLRRQKQK